MATQTVQQGYGGKAEYQLLATAARTATPTIDDVVVPYGKTLTVIIDVTAGAATPQVTPKISGVTASGIVYTILTGATITATTAATVVMRVGAGVAEVANLGTGIPAPAKIRVAMTHGDADSLTYTVDIMVS